MLELVRWKCGTLQKYFPPTGVHHLHDHMSREKSLLCISRDLLCVHQITYMQSQSGEILSFFPRHSFLLWMECKRKVHISYRWLRILDLTFQFGVLFSTPQNTQYILCGFKVIFFFLGGKIAFGKENKHILLLVMEMKSSGKILFLVTIKTIIKGIKCSSGSENIVWLVGFIVRQDIIFTVPINSMVRDGILGRYITLCFLVRKVSLASRDSD